MLVHVDRRPYNLKNAEVIMKTRVIGCRSKAAVNSRSSKHVRSHMLLKSIVLLAVALSCIFTVHLAIPFQAIAQPPEPVVAIHVSELTQALDTTHNGWWTSWHYFVLPESLKEALRSDGTPFVEVSDADIAAGSLQFPDGLPRYPILISLASEAIATNEIAPLRNYVAAGGFLFVGSSAFTRNPDGTTRGDFALANELGLHMVHASSLENWGLNMAFSKVANHRLVAHIPTGTLSWRMPISSDEISSGCIAQPLRSRAALRVPGCCRQRHYCHCQWQSRSAACDQAIRHWQFHLRWRSAAAYRARGL